VPSRGPVSAKQRLEPATLRGEHALLFGNLLDVLAQVLHTQTNRGLTFSQRRDQLDETQARLPYFTCQRLDFEKAKIHCGSMRKIAALADSSWAGQATGERMPAVR
jgi:hypothetical protein